MKVVLQHLTKKFPSRDRKNPAEVVAVNDFDFEIPDGKLIGLLGPSGCGKSTTLNLICGLQSPTEGKIFFGEDDVTDLPPENRGVGLVFQNYALYPHLTVRQNITFPLENLRGKARLSKAEMNAKAEEAAKLVQIDTLMERKPSELSGGQQQRVAIARALATDPKVLLCDEATSALDPKTTRQILELIRDINREMGITVVIITHQMSVVKEVCSHVAILDDGCVAESGRVGTVFAAPKSEAGRRLVFPSGADAQVYNPADEKLVRLVFKDSAATSLPLIARLASEEGILCNIISASTQKISETVYGSMMLGIPSAQLEKAVAFIHNVADIQVEEVGEDVQ